MTFMKQQRFPAKRTGVSLHFCLSLVLMTAISISVASIADAEQPDPRRQRTSIILRISEALDLDEDQTLKLAAKYRHFDKRRHELIGQREVTESELETALGRSPQDEPQIRKLTDQLLSIDKELILMPDALFESVQDMLDTNQRAKLALLKIKLQRKIDRERTRRQQKRSGGGSGGKK